MREKFNNVPLSEIQMRYFQVEAQEEHRGQGQVHDDPLEQVLDDLLGLIRGAELNPTVCSHSYS